MHELEVWKESRSDELVEGFAKGITLDDVVHCPSFDLPQENHTKTPQIAR